VKNVTNARLTSLLLIASLIAAVSGCWFFNLLSGGLGMSGGGGF
jgi:hypothetical protein